MTMCIGYCKGFETINNDVMTKVEISGSGKGITMIYVLPSIYLGP